MVELGDKWEDSVVWRDEIDKKQSRLGHGEHAALTGS